MKIRTCQILSLGAALCLAPLTSTLAQSNWETTDAALPFAGRDIVADPAGNFIGLNLDYTTTNAITSVVRTATMAPPGRRWVQLAAMRWT